MTSPASEGSSSEERYRSLMERAADGIFVLSNAVKYGMPGTPLDVTIVWREQDVEVVVTNRGRGIAPEDRERVFRRFERTSGAKGKKGLGLGLYICRGLVAAHGGRIWVDGAADLTSFHFTLPVTIRARASGIEGLASSTGTT